jgi:hypothetical protein
MLNPVDDVLLPTHVVISLAGIATGCVMASGLIGGWLLRRWTAASLGTNVATDLTGYVLPATTILPSHIVGAISLIALTVAIVALYRQQLSGRWRSAFVIAAMLAVYLNLFVGVVQAFRRIPLLTVLAPTESEPPFAIAQGVLLLVFIITTWIAVKRFRETHQIRDQRKVVLS